MTGHWSQSTFHEGMNLGWIMEQTFVNVAETVPKGCCQNRTPDFGGWKTSFQISTGNECPGPGQLDSGILLRLSSGMRCMWKTLLWPTARQIMMERLPTSQYWIMEMTEGNTSWWCVCRGWKAQLPNQTCRPENYHLISATKTANFILFPNEGNWRVWTVVRWFKMYGCVGKESEGVWFLSSCITPLSGCFPCGESLSRKLTLNIPVFL